jgi:hypothetical protein
MRQPLGRTYELTTACLGNNFPLKPRETRLSLAVGKTRRAEIPRTFAFGKMIWGITATNNAPEVFRATLDVTNADSGSKRLVNTYNWLPCAT